MEEQRKRNAFRIGESERLYLNDIELKAVTSYNLSHSAGDTAELTVTLAVEINQSDSEQG